MTQEERLKLYKKALRDYKLSNLFIIGYILKFFLNTRFGFCNYFASSHYIYGSFEEKFPELRVQEPETKQYITYSGFELVYWFKPGDLESRIECLKNAIKQIENEKIE